MISQMLHVMLLYVLLAGEQCIVVNIGHMDNKLLHEQTLPQNSQNLTMGAMAVVVENLHKTDMNGT